MRTDGAETAAGIAAAVRGDGVLDHLVGRDARRAVSGVGTAGERQGVERVQLFGGQWCGRRMHHQPALPMPLRQHNRLPRVHVLENFPCHARKSPLALLARRGNRVKGGEFNDLRQPVQAAAYLQRCRQCRWVLRLRAVAGRFPPLYAPPCRTPADRLSHRTTCSA